MDFAFTFFNQQIFKMLVLICSDVLELMDGGSKAEINNFEEDNLIEPLDDVDQAVDNADDDDLENIKITCSENISR